MVRKFKVLLYTTKNSEPAVQVDQKKVIQLWHVIVR